MSIYHYTNKVTGEGLVFGSMGIIENYELKLGSKKHIDLTHNEIRYQFTTLKKKIWTDKTDTHIIQKLPGIIRSKRKN